MTQLLHELQLSQPLPQIEVTQETKSTQLGSTMTMLAKMQILFAISTISTCCYDDLEPSIS